jgi:hypothetical protein
MSDRSLFVSPSSRPSRSILLAATLVFLGAMPAVAGPLCRPALTVNEVRFSDIQQSQRVWTARVDVDASRCAAKSGRFDIAFTRLKEIGPDLTFSEKFTWSTGQVEVSTVFWEDEGVLDYTIAYVAPCECRQ